MMYRGKTIEKPDINPRFLYGSIVDWKFRNKITKDKEKYCIRVTLKFQNGIEQSFQFGGFSSIEDAEKSKEQIITKLNVHAFVPFRFKVKEFFDYWLYYYMIDEKNITYNTYACYRNIVYKYFVPFWGENKYLDTINRESMINALRKLSSKSMLALGFSVLSSAFSYAKSCNYINGNAAKSAIRALRIERKHEDINYFNPKEQRPTLTEEGAIKLLHTCKEYDPDIYILILLALTTGVRISEAFAIRVCDVDFTGKKIMISHQIGRTLDSKGLEDHSLTAQLIPTKTTKSTREIPIADFVLEEIVAAIGRNKQKYEKYTEHSFLCCQNNGKPFNKNNLFYDRFKKILEIAEIPHIHFHDLRHTYSTLLYENNISLKTIAECMGHTQEEFTKKVYIATPKTMVYDATDVLNKCISELIVEKDLSIDSTIVNDIANKLLQ